jgi:hypothetical protein
MDFFVSSPGSVLTDPAPAFAFPNAFLSASYQIRARRAGSWLAVLLFLNPFYDQIAI